MRIGALICGVALCCCPPALNSQERPTKPLPGPSVPERSQPLLRPAPKLRVAVANDLSRPNQDSSPIERDALSAAVVPQSGTSRDVSQLLLQQHQERARRFDGVMQKLQKILEADRRPRPAEPNLELPGTELPAVDESGPSEQASPADTPQAGDPNSGDWQPHQPRPATGERPNPADGDTGPQDQTHGSSPPTESPAGTDDQKTDPQETSAGTPGSPEPAVPGPQLQNLIPPPEPVPSSVFADGMAAEAILDGPVDRIGLADNLYAIGELQIALEMYQQVDLTQLKESEWFWVKYQIASCFRRLGQTGDAQDQYRRLAGQKKAGWLAATARWWLDQMDARAALEQEIKRQDEVISALTEVFHDSVR